MNDTKVKIIRNGLFIVSNLTALESQNSKVKSQKWNILLLTFYF